MHLAHCLEYEVVVAVLSHPPESLAISKNAHLVNWTRIEHIILSLALEKVTMLRCVALDMEAHLEVDSSPAQPFESAFIRLSLVVIDEGCDV